MEGKLSSGIICKWRRQGKVEGDGRRGWKVSGVGNPANSTSPPVLRPFPPEKQLLGWLNLILCVNQLVNENFGGAKALRPDLQVVGLSYKTIGGRSSQGASQGGLGYVYSIAITQQLQSGRECSRECANVSNLFVNVQNNVSHPSDIGECVCILTQCRNFGGVVLNSGHHIVQCDTQQLNCNFIINVQPYISESVNRNFGF